MKKVADESRYLNRVIDPVIDDYLSVCGAVCICGPKWCGKTWTSSHHANSEFFVGDPSNHFSNRMLAEMNPTFVLEGETPRMIDEWQEVPSLWDAARALVDRRQEKGQFLLTGSSTPKTKGILHSGIGRIVSLRMNTMSLYETNDSTGQISLKELCDGTMKMQMVKETSLEDLAYYIVRGGWPSNLSVDREKAHLMPRAYMEGVIRDDIRRLEGGEFLDAHKIHLLLKSLARNEATTASDSLLLKDIAEKDGESISRNTLMKYLDALERLYLLQNQEPYSPNLRSSLRVKQAEKRHFSDPAMAAALLNLTPEKLLGDLHTFGFLFEALVEHDLSIYAMSFGAKLFHYQDYEGNEMDAVLELEDGEWCAFEIKLGANRIEEGAKSLLKTSESIRKNGGKPPRICSVICGLGNAAYRREDGVFVVPLTALKA